MITNRDLSSRFVSWDALYEKSEKTALHGEILAGVGEKILIIDSMINSDYYSNYDIIKYCAIILPQ